MSRGPISIKKKFSWAEAFYTLAALSFVMITIPLILGEKPRKIGPAVSIDRMEYLKLYVFTGGFLLLGWALSLREKNQTKKEPIQP